MHPSPWSRAPVQPLRRRRIIYLLCGVLFVYLFIKNLPTDVGPHPRWADTRVYRGPQGPAARPIPTSAPAQQPASKKKPPRPAGKSVSEEHYHDGPIKFYKLAASLHAVAKLGGSKDQNSNVLFAASSLKSVSEILPLACEMARWERNDVHLALTGRDTMEISDIMDINGITQDECDIYWHDARPDFAEWSTDFRMESSVAASLEHIQTFIHPQVILIDDVKREDHFFVTAVREKSVELVKPLIELPSSAMENLMWLTRLDSTSLAAWPKVYIDIIIQAPSASSGSVVRLLKSLEYADYFGFRRPHLTIELPETLDESTSRFLDYFTWPPIDWSGAPHASQLTLRHRISRKTASVEEASARLVEAFWPKRTLDSHVLLLSPQAELSPLYFHYLLYTILEYRYSQLAKQSDEYQKMMGISLDLPKYHLDDKTTFTPPTSKKSAKSANSFPASQAPFLWQNPNDNAVLYFGDKWMEFHSYLTLRFTKPRSVVKKLLSENHPAWLEYLFDFIRLRGYSVLFPGTFFKDFNLVTIHKELYQIPEEFLKQPKATDAPIPSGGILEAESPSVPKRPPIAESPLLETSLVDVLPNKADLLEVDRMPLLASTGHAQTFGEAAERAQKYSEEFKASIGGCINGLKPLGRSFRSAVDLFCGSDEPYDLQDALVPSEPATSVPAPAPAPLKAVEKFYDPDAISEIDAKMAVKESASHLDRQTGGQPVNQRPKDPDPAMLIPTKDTSQRKIPQSIGSIPKPNSPPDSGALPKDEGTKEGTNRLKDDKDAKEGSDKAVASTIQSITPTETKSSEATAREGDDKKAKDPGW